MKTFLFRPLQLCSSTGMDPLMKTIREVSLVFPIRKSAVAAGDGSKFRTVASGDRRFSILRSVGPSQDLPIVNVRSGLVNSCVNPYPKRNLSSVELISRPLSSVQILHRVEFNGFEMNFKLALTNLTRWLTNLTRTNRGISWPVFVTRRSTPVCHYPLLVQAIARSLRALPRARRTTATLRAPWKVCASHSTAAMLLL